MATWLGPGFSSPPGCAICSFILVMSLPLDTSCSVFCRQCPAAAKQRRLMAAAEVDWESWLVCPLQCQFRKLISGPSPLDCCNEALDCFFCPVCLPVFILLKEGGSVLSARVSSSSCFLSASHLKSDSARFPFSFLLPSLDSLDWTTYFFLVNRKCADCGFIEGGFILYFMKSLEATHINRDKWLLLFLWSSPLSEMGN